MILKQIEQDLKQAMLASDKQLVSTLRGLKNAINYAQVGSSSDQNDFSDEKIIAILQKESKKRQEAFSLYKKAGEEGRAESEKYEEGVIGKYLPEPMSDQEIVSLIDEARQNLGEVTNQNMGQVIAYVKNKAQGRADGGQIASIVKEYIK